jgi:outer membrane protein TolC
MMKRMRVGLLFMSLLFLLLSPAWSAEQSVKLTLSESIKQALDHNLDLRIAKTQLQETESQVAQSKASFKPKMSLELAPATWAGKLDSLDYEPQAGLSVGLLTKGGTTYSLNLEQKKEKIEEAGTSLSFTVAQKILPSPRVNPSYLALEKSLLDLEQKKLTIEEEKNHLKFEVTVNFYEILKTQSEIELNRIYLEQARENLLVVKDKFENQSASDLDLLNAQVEVANAQESVFQSQDDLFQYSGEFKDLLGIDQEVQVELIAESHPEPEPLELTFEEAVREALANRLDIKKGEFTIKQSELDLALAKSKGSPSLSLSGAYNYTEPEEERPEEEEYTASLIFQIPLVDGGENKAEIEEARSRLKEANLNLEKLKRDIRAEVREHFLSLQQNLRKIEFLKLSEKRYEKDLEIAGIRFSRGSITESELREKEITFKQAEISLLDALVDCETARSTFLKSLGRGL